MSNCNLKMDMGFPRYIDIVYTEMPKQTYSNPALKKHYNLLKKMSDRDKTELVKYFITLLLENMVEEVTTPLKFYMGNDDSIVIPEEQNPPNEVERRNMIGKIFRELREIYYSICNKHYIPLVVDIPNKDRRVIINQAKTLDGICLFLINTKTEIEDPIPEIV